MVKNDVFDDVQKNLRIYLYRPTSPYNFHLESIAFYLAEVLGNGQAGSGVEVRDEFIQNYILQSDDQSLRKRFAETMANCRLEDIQKNEFPAESSENLRVFFSAMELNLLEGIPPERSRDFMYHGPRLMSAFRSFIPADERQSEHVHIIFTDRLFFSWADSDARYHARATMMGFPHLISMPGIVEAPARPREYYIKRHLYASSGLDPDELEAEFAGQYLIYKDTRTVDVLKGYCLQNLFYTLFNEPFCDDPACRLFNAHWQEELLNAQVNSGKLCDRHQKMLDDWKSS